MKMLKQEWKQLLAKPLLLGTMIVMMFIPIIYGGFFLGSSWDPYGKTELLPVAVVNEDEPAEYEGHTLSIGQELVDNLKDNEDLEWHFTNAKEAERGMEDGHYFMVLTIPEDFSFNASTATGIQPKPMNLQFETNPGRSFFAEAVSKQATASIREEIAENVTQEYVKAVFAQIEAIGSGMEDAADGAGQLEEGSADLAEGNAKLTASLTELAAGTLNFQEGADQLEIGVRQFADGVLHLDSGAEQLGKGVLAYTEGVGSLQTGINGLAEGAFKLSDGGSALIQGSADLANGIGSLLPGAQQLDSGLSKAQTGSSQLNDGLHELASQTSQLADPASGIGQLVTGQQTLNAGLAELETGSQTLKEGLAALDGKLPANGQIISLQQGLAGIKESMSQLNNSVSAGGAVGVSGLQENIAAAQQALEKLENDDGASNAVAALEAAPAYAALTAEQQAELSAAVSRSDAEQKAAQQAAFETLSASLSAISADLSDSIIPAFQSLGALPEQIAGLNSAVAQVAPAASEALNGYASIHGALGDQLIPGAAALNSGIAEASQGSDELLAGTAKTAEKIPQLAAAVNRLAEGSSSLNDGVSALASGSTGLVRGASELQEGSQQLQEGTAAYTAGVSKVAEGASQLQEGSNELAENSAGLNAGVNELKEGTNQLVGGLPSLTGGAGELANGAGAIGKGANAIESGSEEIGSGIGQLLKGSDKLAGSLEGGAEEISEPQLTDANIEMIAAPAKATEHKLSEVPNYGHALAPYILSLGLYVGALSFNLVFPINVPAGRPTSGTAWWLSKFSLGAVQATASALIVDAIMLLGFKLQVLHIGEFIGISIVTSLAYMFLIMFLGITLGNPGRFLAMIILVVQLGASGGTFPVELTNSFFQTMHDLVPMSYALLGFREAMSSAYGTETFVTSALVLAGFVVAFNFLLWVVLSVRTRKQWKTTEAI
ncbi:YhgE/Pip domain-containing protein [Planomicrobium sp. CPCC 101079]|uniref:YhgE/Pip domain-containing protein n=1 Tax=Planomicrobium sp. CPCC 101079 TaxID=2599618 RepID=UPI0011B82A81|nr:YhgE/Pip domain-containing protein [Planomicrobium sp. CPCC 101079]TWT02414.1 YhgE/Pip domain-containing protein [Planomicrobium sp. CPCC 101079]